MGFDPLDQFRLDVVEADSFVMHLLHAEQSLDVKGDLTLQLGVLVNELIRRGELLQPLPVRKAGADSTTCLGQVVLVQLVHTVTAIEAAALGDVLVDLLDDLLASPSVDGFIHGIRGSAVAIPKGHSGQAQDSEEDDGHLPEDEDLLHRLSTSLEMMTKKQKAEKISPAIA